ncbi:MAG TPA: flagellar biosynthesis protein FliQ [Anaerolineaceae bacterium]
MTEATVLNLAQDALMVALILAAPALIASLVVGSLVSLIQVATQINEATLTFVPKIISIGLILLLLGSWMVQQLISYTTNLFTNLPNFIR